MSPTKTTPDVLLQSAYPLTGEATDYDPLMEQVDNARFVLIGEASHGTHEFYRERAEITKRLIQEKGFTAIAVEADWPDAYRVNRYVRAASEDTQTYGYATSFGLSEPCEEEVVNQLVELQRCAADYAQRDGRVPEDEFFYAEQNARLVLERVIGVIYRPETERVRHYFESRLPDQFDAVLHFDETRAVEPLERTPQWETGEAPETFPSGF